jgi:hypothetical protein
LIFPFFSFFSYLFLSIKLLNVINFQITAYPADATEEADAYGCLRPLSFLEFAYGPATTAPTKYALPGYGETLRDLSTILPVLQNTR